MFAKKTSSLSRPPAPQPVAAPPPARPAGWVIQILTTDYIATGFFAPVEMPLVGWLNVPTQSMVSLSPAQVVALDPRMPVASEAVPEITIPKAAIVAVIPRDEPSLRSILLQMPPNAERALIYAGSYWLRASFRLPGSMPLRNLFGATTGDMLAVSDVEIRSARVDTNFQAEKAAAAVVSKRWVQLYHPG
jgi:hypothetical protein